MYTLYNFGHTSGFKKYILSSCRLFMSSFSPDIILNIKAAVQRI